MDCKFLDSYQADLDGSSIDVWYCRKRDPFVLGPSREVALATCSGCRLSDNTRPPSELAYEVERRNQELVALNAIVSAVNSSLDLSTVLNTGLDKAMEILQVDAGWVSLASDDGLQLALHRGVSDEYARAISTLNAQEGVVGLVARDQETTVVEDISPDSPTLPLAGAEGLRTVLATPLKAQGKLLGVMAVATRAARSYSADDIYFVSSSRRPSNTPCCFASRSTASNASAGCSTPSRPSTAASAPTRCPTRWSSKPPGSWARARRPFSRSGTTLSWSRRCTT